MNDNSKQRPLKNWAQVNDALAVLSQLNAEREAVENRFCPQIERLAAEMSGEVAPINEQIEAIEERIRAYVNLHVDEFAKNKTKDLAAGSVSVRKATRVDLEDEAKTATALLDLGYENCVKVVYKPVKAAIKNFGKAVLDLIGAAIVDDIVIKINPIKAKG